MSTTIPRTPQGPTIEDPASGVKKLLVTIVFILIAVLIYMKSEDIKRWFIEEFIDYDDYSFVDNDDDEPKSDTKYVERYLNSTYGDSCSIDTSDTSYTTYDCRIANGKVYAYIEENEDGSISVKDGYYYTKYASLIEGNVASLMYAAFGDRTIVEFENDYKHVTNDMENPSIKDFTSNYPEQLKFTATIVNMEQFTNVRYKYFVTNMASTYKYSKVTFKDKDGNELFTVECKDGHAEMDYYEFAK